MVDEAKKTKKKDPRGIVTFWLRKLEKSEAAHKEYREQAEEAIDQAYDKDLKHWFNVLWSTNQVLKSTTFARTPVPDVRRRYQKPDRDEKELARLVERAITYNIDSNPFEGPATAVVGDFIDAGLGVPRVVYDVVTSPIPDPIDEAFEGEPGEPTYDQGLTKIASQSLSLERHPYNDFRWEPSQCWDDVNWIAYRKFKDYREVNDEYKSEIKGAQDKKRERRADKYADLVAVWEIWHRPSRTVYVICPNWKDGPLDQYDDPLRLAGFYPSPEPAMLNVKNDELVPKPDYQFVANQVKQINRLSQRIYNLTGQIKDVSAFDQVLGKDFRTILSKEDGYMHPVKGLIAKLAGVGANSLDSAILTMPNDRKVQVIVQLMAQLETALRHFYEITGVSDIVRGVSDPRETKGAQQIKAQYANVRLNGKIKTVARVFRDVFRIYAEILCEHFDPKQLELMTGIEVAENERMIAMMKSDIGRSYSIDIETDSTIAADDIEDRKQTIEMIDTLVSRMGELIPGVTNGMLTPAFVEKTLVTLAHTYKHGKGMEDAIHEQIEHMKSLPDLQAQNGQLQQQLEQMQGALEQAQGQLAQVNEREEARKDKETQIKEIKTASEVRDTDVDNERGALVDEAKARNLDADTATKIREATEPQLGIVL